MDGSLRGGAVGDRDAVCCGSQNYAKAPLCMGGQFRGGGLHYTLANAPGARRYPIATDQHGRVEQIDPDAAISGRDGRGWRDFQASWKEESHHRVRREISDPTA